MPSYKKFLNISMADFNRMTEKELRKAVSIMTSAANKRVRTLEKHGEKSPAWYGMSKSGGKFSTKKKTANQLRAEYIRTKNYLESETSTLKGWRNVKRETISELKHRHNIEITESQFDDFWKAYERLKELNPDIETKQFKYNTLGDISEYMYNKVAFDEIVEQMNKQIKENYEAYQEEKSRYDGVGGYFK